MLKLSAIIALYALAIAALYVATSIAPDMKWPANATEMQAAQLMILGMIAKFGGHALLLSVR